LSHFRKDPDGDTLVPLGKSREDTERLVRMTFALIMRRLLRWKISRINRIRISSAFNLSPKSLWHPAFTPLFFSLSDQASGKKITFWKRGGKYFLQLVPPVCCDIYRVFFGGYRTADFVVSQGQNTFAFKSNWRSESRFKLITFVFPAHIFFGQRIFALVVFWSVPISFFATNFAQSFFQRQSFSDQVAIDRSLLPYKCWKGHQKESDNQCSAPRIEAPTKLKAYLLPSVRFLVLSTLKPTGWNNDILNFKNWSRSIPFHIIRQGSPLINWSKYIMIRSIRFNKKASSWRPYLRFAPFQADNQFENKAAVIWWVDDKKSSRFENLFFGLLSKAKKHIQIEYSQYVR